jgi:peptidoglycan/xylan/chitin deacetylase (PgdA/CDA1 family)
MMLYFAKTPALLKKMYPACVWNFNRHDQTIYLTFDDGPHSEATPMVLDTLKEYGAKATFFCIGKNVVANPELYKRILVEGHATGNHTHNHVNGWKTPDAEYIKDIVEARKYIDSTLFRPPYGRISRFQTRLLTAGENQKQLLRFRIIMWDVLSGDFDVSLNADKCAQNVTRNATSGSIVVFHDSAKALPRMKGALVQTLNYFSGKGFKFEAVV